MRDQQLNKSDPMIVSTESLHELLDSHFCQCSSFFEYLKHETPLLPFKIWIDDILAFLSMFQPLHLSLPYSARSDFRLRCQQNIYLSKLIKNYESKVKTNSRNHTTTPLINCLTSNEFKFFRLLRVFERQLSSQIQLPIKNTCGVVMEVSSVLNLQVFQRFLDFLSSVQKLEKYLSTENNRFLCGRQLDQLAR